MVKGRKARKEHSQKQMLIKDALGPRLDGNSERRGSISDYDIRQKIGEGMYGVVFLAIDKEGNQCAIKKTKLFLHDEGVPGTTIREMSVLKQLEHPHVVRLKDVIFTEAPQTLYLVFEFLELDLLQYMNRVRKLCRMSGLAPSMPADLVQSYMRQLLEGCQFCHLNRIMHRDLKPSNLLVSETGRLKIADFGLARAFTVPLQTYTHEVMTLWYRAPEVLLGTRKYTTAVDIWSVGAIFAEMLSHKVLFQGDSQIHQIFCQFQALGTPSEASWPGLSQLGDWRNSFPKFPGQGLAGWCPRISEAHPCALDLLKRMLVLDPTKRLSARAALNHPYFSTCVT